uniref:Immunoglobulin heavy variable 13-2 n=1 Tax=Scleropages formosus TaxID=113540 RepID=A0A8C9TCC3_SCLFO
MSLYFLRGVNCEVTLTQSEPAIKRPGERTKISCKAAGYTFTDYNINWIRLFPPNKFEWLGYITSSSSTGYTDSVKGQMTMTRDNGQNMAYLEINNLKTEDTALYYCVRYNP